MHSTVLFNWNQDQHRSSLTNMKKNTTHIQLTHIRTKQNKRMCTPGIYLCLYCKYSEYHGEIMKNGGYHTIRQKTLKCWNLTNKTICAVSDIGRAHEGALYQLEAYMSQYWANEKSKSECLRIYLISQSFNRSCSRQSVYMIFGLVSFLYATLYRSRLFLASHIMGHAMCFL